MLGLGSGAVDGDGFVDGVDEPSELGTVGDPHIHLLLQRSQPVGFRPNFDYEVRTNASELSALFRS